MAYYINFTGGWAGFPALQSAQVSEYSWDIEFRAANNTSDEFLVLSDSEDVENFIIIRNNNTIDYKVNSVQKAFTITDATDESAVYRFEARGGVISLYENGNFKDSQTYTDVKVGGTIGAGFNRVANARGDVIRQGALYYLKYTDNNNPLNNRFYDPSESNGSGSTLFDTANNQNGSLTGSFSWIFYEDSGTGTGGVIIPVESRVTWTDVAKYLTTLNFEGNLEDKIISYLEGEGFGGTWNEAWYDYWESLGYTGTFPDKWYKWKKELPPLEEGEVEVEQDVNAVTPLRLAIATGPEPLELATTLEAPQEMTLNIIEEPVVAGGTVEPYVDLGVDTSESLATVTLDTTIVSAGVTIASVSPSEAVGLGRLPLQANATYAIEVVSTAPALRGARLKIKFRR